MRTKSTFSFLLTLLILALAPYASGDDKGLLVGPYLQQTGPDQVQIMWLTEEPAVAWVTCQQAGQAAQKVMDSEHGLVRVFEKIHRVELNGLQPGEAYTYSAHWRKNDKETGSEQAEHRTDPFSFSLAREDAPFTLLAFSDIHHNTALLRRLNGHLGGDKADMLVLVGDMMDSIGTENRLVQDVLRPLTKLTDSATPFVWVRGNHETRGVFAYHMQDYIALPNGQYYHAFQAGPVYLIVLDSGEDKPDDHPEYMGLADFDRYRAEEEAWLRRALASEACKQAPYRVVLVHNPPAGGGYTGKTVRSWARYFNDAKVDLLIAGHLHEGRIYPVGTGEMAFPIAQCGGRTMEDGAAFRITFDEAGIDLTLYHADGRELDHLHIKKAAGELTDWVAP